MQKYRVLSPILNDHKHYDVGAIIKLTPSEATPLLSAGVIEGPVAD